VKKMRKFELVVARNFGRDSAVVILALQKVKPLLRNHYVRKKFKVLLENLSANKVVFFSERLANEWIDKIIIGVTSGFFTKSDLQKIKTFLSEVLTND